MVPKFDANPLVHMDTPGIFFDMGPATSGGRKGSMLQLALKLTKITFAALKTVAGKIKTGLTGNTHFPAPTTTPAMIQTAVDDLTTAETQLAAAEEAVGMKRENVEQMAQALRNVLNAVGIECLDKVKNDTEEVARMKLMSANLTLKAPGSPAEPVDRPENFHISQGDHSGEVDGGCNKVANAKMYRVRYSTTLNGPWETKYEGTKSSFTISTLPTGICFMQMAAFGTNGGWSEWSDLASIHVV